MTIAIIGARNITKEQSETLKRYLTKNYPTATKVISGGATGTDNIAEIWANDMNIEMEVYHPNYQAHGKIATHLRNTKIVEETKKQGGILIAYQPNGATNGTQGTIQKAIKASLEVTTLYTLESEKPTIGKLTAIYAITEKPAATLF